MTDQGTAAVGDLDAIMAEHTGSHWCGAAVHRSLTCQVAELAKRARDAEAKLTDAWNEGWDTGRKYSYETEYGGSFSEEKTYERETKPYRAAVGGDHEQPTERSEPCYACGMGAFYLAKRGCPRTDPELNPPGLDCGDSYGAHEQPKTCAYPGCQSPFPMPHCHE